VPYIDVNGVHTYYETEGQGDPLLLLHGGTAPIETWGAQRPALATKYTVYLPERRGHGRTPDVAGPITYETMADDTIAFMDALGISNAHIVGWSDGANIGMIMAIRRPDLVRTLVSIGGNFHHNGLTAEFRESMRAWTPESFAPPLAALHGRISPGGPESFGVMLKKVVENALTGPTLRSADLAKIAAPTLVLTGDEDCSTLEHTIELFRSVPNAQLCIVPGASHTVPLERPAIVNEAILTFLASPMRRPSAM
jgi:pimeloyl-ACP methyl ester carboxylesterase